MTKTNIFEEEQSEVLKYFDNQIISQPSSLFNQAIHNLQNLYPGLWRSVIDKMEFYDENGKTARQWQQDYERRAQNILNEDVKKVLYPYYRPSFACKNCGKNARHCQCDADQFVKSPRMYPVERRHFLHLSKELRNVILNDYFELDINFSQLTFLIKQLGLEVAPQIIKDYGSPWAYYEQYDPPLPKNISKKIIYSSAYGSKILSMVAKSGLRSGGVDFFFKEPMIVEILKKRDRQLTELSFAETCMFPNNKMADVRSYRTVELIKGKDHTRTIFASLMQSQEFCVIAKVFEKMNSGELPAIVAFYLHDALYVPKCYATDISHFLNVINKIEPEIVFSNKQISLDKK